MRIKKEAQWPVRARGREYGLRGGSDRPDLGFLVTFGPKPKVTALAAIERYQAVSNQAVLVAVILIINFNT